MTNRFPKMFCTIRVVCGWYYNIGGGLAVAFKLGLVWNRIRLRYFLITNQRSWWIGWFWYWYDLSYWLLDLWGNFGRDYAILFFLCLLAVFENSWKLSTWTIDKKYSISEFGVYFFLRINFLCKRNSGLDLQFSKNKFWDAGFDVTLLTSIGKSRARIFSFVSFSASTILTSVGKIRKVP